MSLAQMRLERDRKEKEMIAKYGPRHTKKGYDVEHDGDATRFKAQLENEGAIDVDIRWESDGERSYAYFSYFKSRIFLKENY